MKSWGYTDEQATHTHRWEK